MKYGDTFLTVSRMEVSRFHLNGTLHCTKTIPPIRSERGSGSGAHREMEHFKDN